MSKKQFLLKYLGVIHLNERKKTLLKKHFSVILLSLVLGSQVLMFFL